MYRALTIPKFVAAAPDPAYAIGKDGRDGHVSKQARLLQAAGYDKPAIGAFLLWTDPVDYQARLVETNAIRIYIHMSAEEIGQIRGYTYDPEHVFCLALESSLTCEQVRNSILTIKAQHDEDTHTDTTRRIDSHSHNSEIYAARAAQVASHGRK